MDNFEKRLPSILASVADAFDFRTAATNALRGDDVRVCGLTASFRAFYCSGIWRFLQRPLIVLLANDRDVLSFASDLSFFHTLWAGREPERIGVFPGWETDPYAGLSPHADIQRERATTLWKLRQRQLDVVVSSARALATRLVAPSTFETYGLRLISGEDLSQELLLEHLTNVGYLRREPVEGMGEFSVRGGIVDVFSPLMRNPVRVEFFGDTVDSIREFDMDDQRSRGPLGQVDLLPMTESVLTRESMKSWALAAPARWNDPGCRRDLQEKVELAENGEVFPGASFLLSSFHPVSACLLDYIDQPVLLIDEPAVVLDQYEKYYSAVRLRFDQTQHSGAIAVGPEELLLQPDHLATRIQQHRRIGLHVVGETENAGNLPATQPVMKFHGRIRDFVESVQAEFRAGRQAVVVGSTLGISERFRDVLHEYGVPLKCDFGDQPLKAVDESKAPVVAVGKLTAGFRIPSLGVEFLAETDVFDEAEHLPAVSRRRQKVSTFLSELQDLKAGDYIVHVDHGIGTYGGITSVHDRECMVVFYQGGDKLYVPLERLDLVEKYSSTEGAHPQLDKLGGTTWVVKKAKVKRAIRDMAQELLRLYAERKVAAGHAFSTDTEWQKEFEESFPYDETTDQLSAIADIKRDMETPIPMDRLICGDVGYGKTEVAMRAAFKCVSDGKQVAFLAPTTVLCYQHFETIKERFAAFPFTVAMMSRFVSPKAQKQVLLDLETGKVDIVVGTHRLLSKDIRFQDLGLLVVDEEQRFGVSHKERLKHLRKQVDVLTLTATPIPRTLNMALSGLRDMSVIETPPRDRLAIQTSVVKFKPAVIQAAIDFELERGGQVYVLHNRVESIYSLANFIQKICPKARVGVGHGQLGEKELEGTMLRFMKHEFDVLVATTIIENGLDIPLANTLIVNRADRYGLAQLYQLRGRVGRSNRRAYAYLLIASDETLTPIARRRLAAIREFSDLGAGFRIAALDLELRGAGNLLGGQQHGHIEAIGFELYLQLLERTVDELRTGHAQPEVETAVNLKFDLRIGADFVDDEMQRLKLYKRIASSRTEPEIDELYKELEDRFGELPSSVQNLMEYARLRLLGRARGVMSIDRTSQGVDIKFHESAKIDPERLVSLVENREGAGFVPPATLRVRTGGIRSEILSTIQDVLRELR